MEAPPISDLRFINLPNRSDCPIAYTLKSLKGEPHTDTTTSSHVTTTNHKSITWLIFVNGLGLPQAFWQPTMQLLESDLTSKTSPTVSSYANSGIYATTYDRYGQGHSRPPQHDANTDPNNWKPAPHNSLDAAAELAELIQLIRPLVLSSHHATTSSSLSNNSQIQIVLIGHSLGVPITRLFVERHNTPEIAGLLLIDSNMAGVNMVDLLPDPNDLSTVTLPADTTIEQLRQTRANYSKLFAPSAPNAENLDRVSLLTLLPRADAPVLAKYHEYGPGNQNGNEEEKRKRLALTIVAHDPDAFAEEGLKIATRGLTTQFIEPAWRTYNRDLLRLDGSDEEDDQKRIVVASGAGHFVQRDNPRCVADEIWKIVERL